MNDRKIKKFHRAGLALMDKAYRLDRAGQKTTAYTSAQRAFKLLERALRQLVIVELKPIHIASFRLAANIGVALGEPDRVLDLIDEWLKANPPGKAANEVGAIGRLIMAASMKKAATMDPHPNPLPEGEGARL